MNMLIRFLAWSIALSLVALPLVAVTNGWLAADRWPIQRLQLTAEFQRVNADQIRSAVAPHLGRGYFALDLPAVHAAAASLPWAAEVEVRKRWPDVLEIRLVEHRAVARWGEDRLVSDRGGLFAAPGGEVVQGLPELAGPDDRLDEVLAFHAAASRVLAASGLGLQGVRLSQRGSWSLVLGDGGRVMLGRSDTLPRLRRLARHLPALLAADGRPLERADLRYSNGFALRWQDPAAPAAPRKDA